MLNPTICQWDLTPVCNLNCKHCRIREREFKPLDHSDLLCLADKLAISTVTSLAIAGGEPLAYPKLGDIMAHIGGINHIMILTNGTLINRDTVKLLKQYRCDVQVSLDGGTEHTHDTCRGKGSFAKSVNGIGLLRDNKIPFWTRLTIMPSNKNEVFDFVIMSKSLGANACSIRRCVPVGNASNLEQLSVDEIKLAFGEAYRAGKKVKIKIVSPDPFAMIYYDQTKKEQCERLMSKYPQTCIGGCKSGLTSFYIDPSGKVIFCPYAPIYCGDLLKDNLDVIWRESKTLQYARKIRHNLHGKCASCKYLMVCGGCPAVSFAVTGSILQSDRDCWL